MKIIEVPQKVLDALAAANGDNFGWPEPEEVSHSLRPVPSFNHKMLPKVLRCRAYDIAYRMQCPIDFVAAPMIVMLGSIIGSRCAIRPKKLDDWSEHPNIWGAVIARPGQLKTPATGAVFNHLNLLELNAQQQYDIDKLTCEAEKLAASTVLSGLKHQLHIATKNGGSPPPSGSPIYQQMVQLKLQDDEEPILKRYRTNDATVEKLAELCSQNPDGLLVMRDELVGLLANCVKEGHEGERTFYLEGWNGNGKYLQDRIGRGSIVVNRLCLSVFGNIQPVRLQDFMYGMSGMQNDGLLQRFQVMVYPDKLSKTRIVDKAPNDAAKKAVDLLMIDLANFDPIAWGAERGRGHDTPFFRFYPTAQARFYEWLRELTDKIEAEDSPLLAEHLSKYRKLVPAITLIQHIVSIIVSGKPAAKIAIQQLECAIRWADYLEAHARRIFGQAIDYRVVASHALMKKIKEGKLQDGFSERDVYRACWAQLDNAEVVHEACRELEVAGWLVSVKQESKTKARSPSYNINPKILSECA